MISKENSWMKNKILQGNPSKIRRLRNQEMPKRKLEHIYDQIIKFAIISFYRSVYLQIITNILPEHSLNRYKS